MADDPKPAPAAAKTAAPAPISQTAIVRPTPTDPGGPEMASPEPVVVPPAAVEQPAVAAAPPTMEDASRVVAPPASASARTFPGFPKDKFHPVQGKRTLNDPNEVADLPGPAHNWFDSAEEADMHRTDAEAQQVVMHNHLVKRDARLSAAMNDGKHDLADEAVNGDAGVVRNSVAATENLKSGHAEPL